MESEIQDKIGNILYESNGHSGGTDLVIVFFRRLFKKYISFTEHELKIANGRIECYQKTEKEHKEIIVRQTKRIIELEKLLKCNT